MVDVYAAYCRTCGWHQTYENDPDAPRMAKRARMAAIRHSDLCDNADTTIRGHRAYVTDVHEIVKDLADNPMKSHVKSHDVAARLDDDLDLTTSQIGSALRELERAGVLEPWSPGYRGNVWRIRV